ncbi:MAG: DDE-type integrase/transposase/recombinase, partial [Planctomycetota bacterium]
MTEELAGDAKLRRTRLLEALDIATSSWYRPPVPTEAKKRRGPAPKPIAENIRQAVIEMATANPWYGYQRIAVMCRRAGQAVKDRQAYVVMRAEGLLQQARPREPELYQAAKLFELLPQKPNDLWQMDVTYIHIPGHGWWYAVTVIDYYSRYLLACRLTNSYCAIEVSHALREARQEAERLHGPLEKPPFLVTDNGPSFLARRFGSFIQGSYQ